MVLQEKKTTDILEHITEKEELAFDEAEPEKKMKLIGDIKYVVKNEIEDEEKKFQKLTKMAGKPA